MKATPQVSLLVLLLWQTPWHTTKLGTNARSVKVVPRSSPVGSLANFTVEANRSVVLLRRSDLNQVTLSCRNLSTLTVLAVADFLVTHDPAPGSATPLELTGTLASAGVPYRYPSPTLAEIAFTMQPDIEGYFFCGNLSSMIRSENSITLLGRSAS